MALNKFMHPKNLYKKKQPNFKDLALKYEEFRKHTTQDEAGKVHLDFKDARALKALSWVLLKEDFNLDVDLPLDRLIPTIPLRVNYVLWLSDIVGKKKHVRGIDVGCGASCVYPLLGARMNKWTFLATEADDTNFEFAKKNIRKNDFESSIKLVKSDANESVLKGLLEDDQVYDFTMCNPPFFGSNLEAYAMTSTRNPERPEPNSVSTAAESEAITPGGEVEFVKKMIEESLELKERIRVFTTMLGKKSSVGILKEELRQKGIRNVGSYEFCQGRTMRWGIGWSFDPNVRFPKSPFQLCKTPEKAPLVHTVPKNVGSANYDIQSLGSWLSGLLKEVSLKFTVIMDCEAMWSAAVTARENTWANQRRKRRAEKRAADRSAKRQSPGPEGDRLDMNKNDTALKVTDDLVETALKVTDDLAEPALKVTDGLAQTALKVTNGLAETALEVSGLDKAISSRDVSVPAQRAKNESNQNDAIVHEFEGNSVSDVVSSEDKSDETLLILGESSATEGTSKSEKEKTDNSKSEPVLFNAWFTFKFDDRDEIILEMKWLKGTSRESMHQVMQLIKNRLQSPEVST